MKLILPKTPAGYRRREFDSADKPQTIFTSCLGFSVSVLQADHGVVCFGSDAAKSQHLLPFLPFLWPFGNRCWLFERLTRFWTTVFVKSVVRFCLRQTKSQHLMNSGPAKLTAAKYVCSGVCLRTETPAGGSFIHSAPCGARLFWGVCRPVLQVYNILQKNLKKRLNKY